MPSRRSQNEFGPWWSSCEESKWLLATVECGWSSCEESEWLLATVERGQSEMRCYEKFVGGQKFANEQELALWGLAEQGFERNCGLQGKG